MKIICPSCDKNLTRYIPKELSEIESIVCSCGFEVHLYGVYELIGYRIEYSCDECGMWVSETSDRPHKCEGAKFIGGEIGF